MLGLAILTIAILPACSSDTTTDGGGNDAGIVASDGGDTSTTDSGVTDTGTLPEGCEDVRVNTMHGTVCSDAEANQACRDAGGVCASAEGEDPSVCSQLCIPEDCESVCEDPEVCIRLIDSDVTPDVDESEYGVCGAIPVGTAGPYEQCGQGFGNCADTSDEIRCLVDNPDDPAGMCYPTCTGPGDTSCPSREGFQGSCALSSTTGDDSYCAIVCTTPGASGECPTGMECKAVSGGAMCGY